MIEDVTGRSPVGYRALFSIDRSSLWAYDVLCELGFRYDAGQYDSPRIPNRTRSTTKTHGFRGAFGLVWCAGANSRSKRFVPT